MLQAIGFAPRLEGYGLENTGVKTTDRGAIEVDARGRTNVDGVYAIGDVTGKLMLAHTAEAMGIVAAETIADAETMEIEFDMIPRATYCQPQIASFGYSEEQAKEKGYDVKVAKFPFSANGKAKGLGDTSGFVKLVADAKYNEIIGAHLIGPDVTELLPALTLAQRWDLTADEVARNVFAHPTLSEAVKEAVEGLAGHMIHLYAASLSDRCASSADEAVEQVVELPGRVVGGAAVDGPGLYDGAARRLDEAEPGPHRDTAGRPG